MNTLRDHAWVLALLGTVCGLGFASRAWLLGGVDTRGAVVALCGAALLVAYALLDRDRVEQTTVRRDVRLGGASTLVVLVAALVVVLAYALVREVDDTLDLTRKGSFTLSAHTRQVIDGLDRDVEVLAFFRDGSGPQSRFEGLVSRYTEASSRVSVRWIDPLREPLAAREHDVKTEAGEVLLRAGDREERLPGDIEEEVLTRALVRLTSDVEHLVCWSDGHGEADADDTREPSAMGTSVLALEGENYQVMRVSLVAGTVPETCEVLVVAGPRADFLAYERRALRDWVLGGGQALLMMEPGLAPELAASLRALGVLVGEDLVLDPAADRKPLGVEDPSLLVIPPRTFRAHPMMDGLEGALLLGLARSAAPLDGAPGIATRSLALAGPQSWAETDLTDDAGSFSPDEDEARGDIPVVTVAEVVDPALVPQEQVAPEAPRVRRDEVATTVDRVLRTLLPEDVTWTADSRLGPDLGLDETAARALVRAIGSELGVWLNATPDLTVGLAIDQATEVLAARVAELDVRPPPPQRPGGRIVVIGDAGFATNQGLSFGSNRDLFLDAVAWLSREDDQLGQRPDTTGDVLEITALGQALMALVALLVLPGACLLLAVFAWSRRRGS